METKIRSAKPEDSRAFAEMVKSIFDEYGFAWDEQGYCADLYDLGAHYLDLGHRFWIAELDGSIVGGAGLESFPVLPGNPGTAVVHEAKIRAAGADCSLERMYVRADVRGRGIGRVLMETVLECARNANRSGMEIWSDKKLEAAHAFYGRIGAQRIGDRVCDDPDESPEWGFYLPLK